MAKSVKVNSTLKDAGKVHSVWKEDVNFVVGETKFDDFAALFNAAEGLNKDCAEEDAQLAGLKNTGDEKARQVARHRHSLPQYRTWSLRSWFGSVQTGRRYAVECTQVLRAQSQTGFGKSAASRIVARAKL